MNSTTVTLSDFDITYYPGLTAQDIIPKLITNLQTTFEKLPQNSIQYKAIQTYIRLLTNYLTISDTFSIHTIETINFFNKLSEYLINYAKQRYPEYDIYIEPKGRIKSPISANTKIKENIFEYMKKGKDLDSLHIKDFIAFRFVVVVRDFFGKLIPEPLTVDVCYDIINQAINFINSYSLTSLLPISSKITANDNISNNVYHPLHRPDYIEQNDKYIKDFMFYPKPKNNYQSAHLQFILSLPTLTQNIFGELQFRTFLMNEHAERGPASHTTYKTREKITYLTIPQILMPIEPYSETTAFLTPDKAFEEFFRISP